MAPCGSPLLQMLRPIAELTQPSSAKSHAPYWEEVLERKATTTASNQ